MPLTISVPKGLSNSACIASAKKSRLAGPHEVAEVIVFLLSDAASYQSVKVTGGMVTY